MLLSDGAQACYSGHPNMKIFLPTTSSAWGRDIAKNVDYALDTLGYDGIYWDELEYSAHLYHYGRPWDGVSADIDPQTMRITRLKTSVTLASQPYRLALAKRILSRGAPLWGNFPPQTRSMANLHFPRFVERGSVTKCVLTHLYTPIALGDDVTEQSEADCDKGMIRALDYGCLYAWYSARIKPTHAHLTSYMYPITPLELHAGYVIGAERIVTNRSGLYGWGDDSAHEVHVFNDQGVEMGGFHAPLVTINGNTFTRLQIGEGWSAAIVRVRRRS